MQLSGQYLINITDAIEQAQPRRYSIEDAGLLDGAPAVFTRVCKDGAVVGTSLLLAFAPLKDRQPGEQIFIPPTELNLYRQISPTHLIPFETAEAQLALSQEPLQSIGSGIALLLREGHAPGWAFDAETSGELKIRESVYRLDNYYAQPKND